MFYNWLWLWFYTSEYTKHIELVTYMVCELTLNKIFNKKENKVSFNYNKNMYSSIRLAFYKIFNEVLNNLNNSLYILIKKCILYGYTTCVIYPILEKKNQIICVKTIACEAGYYVIIWINSVCQGILSWILTSIH